ncbi:MAG: hypothetical protein NT002_00085 [candidate division Zixibacteria bacterium]|nr:hypothetical protein [candidate division Zixibacteria bacterium]
MLKLMPRKSGVALVLVAFMLSLFFVPRSAYAAWEDKSGDLKFGSSPLIIAGVAVAAVVVLLIVTHKDKDKDKDGEEKNKEDDKSSTEMTGSQNLIYASGGANPSGVSLQQKEMPKLNYYLRVESNTQEFNGDMRAPDLSKMTVKAGLTFGF